MKKQVEDFLKDFAINALDSRREKTLTYMVTRQSEILLQLVITEFAKAISETPEQCERIENQLSKHTF